MGSIVVPFWITWDPKYEPQKGTIMETMGMPENQIMDLPRT